MKKWILLLGVLVVLIAVLVFRERYDNYNPTAGPMGAQSGEQGTESPFANARQATPEEEARRAAILARRPVCPDGYMFAGGTCLRLSPPVNGACAAGTLTPTGLCAETAEGACPPGKQVSPQGCVDAPTSTASLSPAQMQLASPTPAQPAGIGKNVFGPAFTELGADGQNAPGDSTKTTQYPLLQGGFPETLKAKAKDEDKLDLPKGKSLGTEPGSEYLPYSREPGDMDLVPNPYKVSSTYAGRESSEPVPFLTDFSAFFR